MSNKVLVSTPIFYSNDELHAGHLYSLYIASIIAKMHLNFGYNVKFTTGLDQYGIKVQKAAEKAKLDPQTFVDSLEKKFKALCDKANIKPDKFIMTSTDKHKKIALNLWNAIQEDLYEDDYEGWYDTNAEAFSLEKTPNSILLKEKCIFFRLSKYRIQIKEYLEQFCPTSFYVEALKMTEKIEDLCVTRSCKWGIQVNETMYMYVWIDALSNYLTFPNYLKNGIHIIGKDILKFHAIYWIGLLLSAKLPLPKKLIVHGWWIYNQEKMSKSLGNVISAQSLLDEFEPDILRWFFVYSKELESDAELSQTSIIAAKEELANTIGNLINRILHLAYRKKFIKFTQCTSKLTENCKICMEICNLRKYAQYIINQAKTLNQEIEIKRLWELDILSAHIFFSDIIPKVDELINLISPITPNFANKWKAQIARIGYEKPIPVVI